MQENHIHLEHLYMPGYLCIHVGRQPSHSNEIALHAYAIFTVAIACIRNIHCGQWIAIACIQDIHCGQ